MSSPSTCRYIGTMARSVRRGASSPISPATPASSHRHSPAPGLNALDYLSVDVPDARSVEFIVVSGVGVQNRVLDSEQVGDSIRFLLQGDLRRRPMNEDVAALVLTDPDAGRRRHVARAVRRHVLRGRGNRHTPLRRRGGSSKRHSAAPASMPWVAVRRTFLDPKDVAFVVLADGNRHRALDAEVETGSVRFQLQPVRHTIERRRLRPGRFLAPPTFTQGHRHERDHPCTEQLRRLSRVRSEDDVEGADQGGEYGPGST